MLNPLDVDRATRSGAAGDGEADVLSNGGVDIKIGASVNAGEPLVQKNARGAGSDDRFARDIVLWHPAVKAVSRPRSWFAC